MTVKNECDWDVPVGLGRGVNSYFFNEKEKEKVTWQRVPPKGQVVFKDVLAGFDDYTFFVLNETTERYSKDDDFRFVKDTTITLFYDFDNLYYRWKHD